MRCRAGAQLARDSKKAGSRFCEAARTALHRQSFGGNDSERFLRLGSAFVISASLPLALGIAADVYVVFLKITYSTAITLAAALALLLAMLLLWYLYPIWLRGRRA